MSAPPSPLRGSTGGAACFCQAPGVGSPAQPHPAQPRTAAARGGGADEEEEAGCFCTWGRRRWSERGPTLQMGCPRPPPPHITRGVGWRCRAGGLTTGGATCRAGSVSPPPYCEEVETAAVQHPFKALDHARSSDGDPRCKSSRLRARLLLLLLLLSLPCCPAALLRPACCALCCPAVNAVPLPPPLPPRRRSPRPGAGSLPPGSLPPGLGGVAAEETGSCRRQSLHMAQPAAVRA